MAHTKNIFKFFCYICKQHFEYSGTSPKDAKKDFVACGHEDRKVAQLKKGLTGS